MASIGLSVNVPNTEERAVFTQLKPVRMSEGDGAEDSSVFEEVKPAGRSTLELSQVRTEVLGSRTVLQKPGQNPWSDSLVETPPLLKLLNNLIFTKFGRKVCNK